MKYRSFKNSLILMSFFGLVIYCSENLDPEDELLIGKWELTEMGDSREDMQPVDSEKFIEFLSNGQIRSNGDLCRPSVENGMETRGVFIMPDSLIKPDNCAGPFTPPRFSVRENEMILQYAKFSSSANSEKYVKVP